jgi:hypothetical protein
MCLSIEHNVWGEKPRYEGQSLYEDEGETNHAMIFFPRRQTANTGI